MVLSTSWKHMMQVPKRIHYTIPDIPQCTATVLALFSRNHTTKLHFKISSQGKYELIFCL